MAVKNDNKVVSLPAIKAPNSTYYVKGLSDTRVRLYVTDASATAFPVGILDGADVLSTLLAGYSVGTNTPLSSTDSVLGAYQKIQGQINALSSLVSAGVRVPLPLDASTNPDYPAATAGDSYRITVSGKIGGASGELVQKGDVVTAIADNSGGSQAAVGSQWYILQANIDSATESVEGITRIATSGEADGLSEAFAYLTPLRAPQAVRKTPLLGYTLGVNSAISPSDTVLEAFGKIQGQIDNLSSTSHNPVTLGSPANGLSLSGQELSLGLASSGVAGALSGTKFDEFNAKIDGTIASSQVAFGTGTNEIGGDGGLTWNNTTDKYLEISQGSDTRLLLAGRVNNNLLTGNSASIVTSITGGSGYPFTSGGNLVLSSRQLTNADTVVLTGLTSENIFSFKGSGRFGILTTNPTHTLDVNGSARIRSINNLGASASFVLVPSATGVLSLRTLSELASDMGVQPAGNYVLETRKLTINGVAQDLSADRSWTVPTHNPVTLGSPANGLSLSAQILSLGLASTSTTGALSSTDWNTFNSKQDALTNPVTGTGTANQVVYWNGTNTQTGKAGFTFNPSSNLLTLLGGLRLTGSQSIATDTGDLMITTGGGNGNVVVNTHGSGIFKVIKDSSGLLANPFPKIEVNNSHNGTWESDAVIGQISISSNDTSGGGSGDRFLISSINKIGSAGSSNATVFSTRNNTDSALIPFIRSHTHTDAAFVGINLNSDPTSTLDVNGDLRVRTVNNAVGDFVTVDSGGLFSKRTSAQVLADLGVSGAYVPLTRTITTNNGITGGGNLSANRTFGLTGQALAFHNLGTNGFAVRTGAGTVASRSFVSAAGTIEITNGNGVSANPNLEMQWVLNEW